MESKKQKAAEQEREYLNVESFDNEATMICYFHGIDQPFTFSCGRCGADVKDRDNYCWLCGAKLTGERFPQEKTARLKDLKCKSASLYGKNCYKVNNRQEPDKERK